MTRLQQLIDTLRSGFENRGVAVLLEPPWIFVLAALIGLPLITVALRRWAGRQPDPEREGRKAMRREAKELVRAGDLRAAGRLFEALDDKRRALETYERGGHGEEQAELLRDMGRRRQAKQVAEAAGAWRLFAEMAEQDDEHAEAGVAFERAGQPYLAGRAYEAAGLGLDAARCYIAAGMEAQAVKLLADVDDAAAGDLLERAIRSGLDATGASGLSLELQRSVRRAVQLLVESGNAERAFRLAIDAHQSKLAVAVARDYAEPSLETAEACRKAGARLVAADLFERLGQPREAALERGEHHRQAGDARQSAEFFEQAEAWQEAADQWAALGQEERAAGLYERAGDLHTAAQLFAQTGDTQRSQALLTRAHGTSVSGRFEQDATERFGSKDPGRRLVDQGAEGHESLGSEDVTRRVNVAESDPTQVAKSPPAELLSADSLQAESPSADSLQGSPNAIFEHATSNLEAHVEAQVAAGSPRATRPAGAVSRYRLIEEIGRGGMGVVYRAEDPILQRQVAYKMVPETILAKEAEASSLLAEARAAAKLSHPNIVQVFDAGRHGDGFFIVMELVDGQNLESVLRQRTLTLGGALHIGQQICAALSHAHDREILHRDLKPSNLMWADQEQKVRLTDFGLARAFDRSGQVMTQSAGTPSYMSPEQIRSEPLTAKADLYALGCVLYEMLCKRAVFGTGASSFHHHLASTPEDPRTYRSEIPDDLAELILACLEKQPEQRPGSASEIGRRLIELG